MNITRDGKGRIETINYMDNGSDGYEETAIEYTYGDTGELYCTRVNGEITELYEYNNSGRRIKDTVIPRDVVNRRYEYNELGQLVRAGGITYTYDNEGRLVLVNNDGKQMQLFYRHDGHLLGARLHDGRTIEYALNNAGQRMSKYVNGRLVEKYHWEGLQKLVGYETEHMQTRIEYDQSGNPVRAIIASAAGDNEYWLECSPVGTLRNIRNHIGQVVKSYKSDSFGNSLDPVKERPSLFAKYLEQVDLPLGFAGGLVDKDTGLIHFGYREYLPDVARWNRPDPLGKAGGDPDVYGYCLDDPINITDKSGLFLDGMFDFFSFASEGISQGIKGAYDSYDTVKSELEDSVPKVKDGLRNSYDTISEKLPEAMDKIPSGRQIMKDAMKNRAAAESQAKPEEQEEPGVFGKIMNGLSNSYDVISEQGPEAMKKIGTEGSAAMKEIADKAPAATGEAFKRLGHEYKTNKDLRNYTAGAVALPVAIATTTVGGPLIAGGARAAVSVADKLTRSMYGRVAIGAEQVASKLDKSQFRSARNTAEYLRKTNAGKIVSDAIDIGSPFLPVGLPPDYTSKASVTGTAAAEAYKRLKSGLLNEK
ncbi:MAG: RHS repeat domain-containing protein [Desulfovibrio sp.]